ncbi:MAG: dTDP-4-amino-4,6-dideoxygalactose transaminase [Bacteroidetes bacterium]|nr:MAG: dTDP-4-amino-4,6-dideoxygalactose transaminase [Bacteroidota bacterium]PIE88485.1 MAG: dTDP-4-amino-4,6-dideoxygalactose transaminase [Bacteroidota bacterium]
MQIPFNKPHFTGKEQQYLVQAAMQGQLSGNGPYTRRAQALFCNRYGVTRSLLTTSCTDALEMAALLFEIGPGDEVIMPSYTFVSSANAFVLRGARVVFVDSMPEHPNMDIGTLERLITPQTKAILVMHYGGVANDMEAILAIAEAHGLKVVEDAAHSIEATYKGKPLGSIGQLGALSFHETKNIITGEGGMLLVNDERLCERAEIIWEKGTNRAAFQRKEVQKYEWVDVGSSFLPSDLTGACLCAQMEEVDPIQARRIRHWERYASGLRPLQERENLLLPQLPAFASLNGHLFYMVAKSREERDRLLHHLHSRGIQAVFHYQALHHSPYYRRTYGTSSLPHAERFSQALIRLPLFYALTEQEIDYVIQAIFDFYR